MVWRDLRSIPGQGAPWEVDRRCVTRSQGSGRQVDGLALGAVLVVVVDMVVTRLGGGGGSLEARGSVMEHTSALDYKEQSEVCDLSFDPCSEVGRTAVILTWPGVSC